MDKKIAVALLALGTALTFPLVRRGIEEISFAGLWFEAGLWIFGLIALVAIGFVKRKSIDLSGRAEKPGFVFVAALVLAIVLMLSANYTGNPAWLLSACGICLSCLLFLLRCFRANRLGHLVLFCLLVPNALWTFTYEIHWIGQRLSTLLAGSILDLAKIFYFSRGNVIGLVSTDFLENQQCAGLRLFGPVLLLVALYGGLRNYGWFRMMFLLAEALFWIVAANALRIAYSAWAQDGQQTAIEFNLVLLDVVCLVGILFLSWSGDQFYSALTYKEYDAEKEEFAPEDLSSSSQVRASVDQLAPGLLVISYLLMVGIIATGGWLLSQGRFVGPSIISNEVVEQAVSELEIQTISDGWSIQQMSDSQESFCPVYKQSRAWSHRQWELTNEKFTQGRMILRIDGAWLHSPRIDWLWHWYGWTTRGFQMHQQDVSSWLMSRSIVEEGCVISKQVYLMGGNADGSACVQVSLVGEGYKETDDVGRTMQRELFEKLIGGIENQLRSERTTGSSGLEAP